MQRVLITGGAGFIGSYLAETLVRAGFEVTVVDDLSTGHRGFVPRAARFRKLDVRTMAFRDFVRQFKPAYVCHLAAQRSAERSRADASADASINVVGTANALAAASGQGLKKFLFVSTAALYGSAREIPTPEHAEPKLSSPYAVAKLAGEQYVSYYGASGNLPVAVVRLANVYGPRQDASNEGGVVARFAQALVAGRGLTIEGRGEQTRDFIYVMDVVQGLMAALTDGSGLYNLGTGEEISIRELAIKMGEIAGVVPKVTYVAARTDDIPRSALSALRAMRELRWRPATPLMDGLRQTLKWYKEL
ncbi:MAG: NAD-dependent epimerase/dehydratase family protein [Candidatus Veblenbacteria bacterium]|nr:NAD-dependent epimerase/dehydratase family protein [Candidatus Veblenbacteria bacterium]MDZ4229706.1 NAD-dependent epimerase/dehydratase family protein [Candidatus Veblenbacteria bacterium]